MEYFAQQTIKPRLKNCPAHEVCGAATTCYVINLRTMDLQETERKIATTKIQAFRSKPTQYRNFTQNHSETKATQERKLKPTNPKIRLQLKPTCEDLKFLRQNTPKKNNNEIT